MTTAALMLEQLEHHELSSHGDLGLLYEDAYERVTCRYDYDGGVSVRLTYAQEQPQPGASPESGRYVWPAAPALCEYLVHHRERIPASGTIVELGAGCGLTGLAIAQLRTDATVVFTDHDPGVLKTIEHNCTQQERKQARCLARLLRWGPTGANEVAELEAELAKPPQSIDMLVGSDVIYAREVVAPLFWTVDRLLTKSPGATFLMCSSSRYDDATEAAIDAQCRQAGLTREILTCRLDQQGSRIQTFTRRAVDGNASS